MSRTLGDYRVEQRLALFPDTACVEVTARGEGLSIAGQDLAGLAQRYGTPLYLYDQATMDSAAKRYRLALSRSYSGAWGLTYASKAFLCVALAQWVQAQGMRLDCTGSGELGMAAAAGMERAGIVVHGVNKSDADLAAAVNRAGTIVVDSLAELERLIHLRSKVDGHIPDLWLRLRPGLAVATHTATQTGQEDSKFGMSRAEAAEAARTCREQELPLSGLHFHLGSQFRDPAPISAALETTLELMATLHAEQGWSPQVVCPGGGLGVAYHEDALPHPTVDDYVKLVAGSLADGCRRLGLPLPQLQLEPGRSLVARAGVALYRVGTVKQTAHRRWLLLDGGLADNPRPALYGTRYSALPVAGPKRPASGAAWLGGPYCESGDVLIEDLPLPDVQPGELLAVPMSGAYQLSMASNYNGSCRPAVVWLQGGEAHLVRRREETSDLVSRDLLLPAG